MCRGRCLGGERIGVPRESDEGVYSFAFEPFLYGALTTLHDITWRGEESGRIYKCICGDGIGRNGAEH